VCLFLCLCTGRGLATSWSPVQGVLPTLLDLVSEVKRRVSWRRLRPEMGCRPKRGGRTLGKILCLKHVARYVMPWEVALWKKNPVRSTKPLVLQFWFPLYCHMLMTRHGVGLIIWFIEHLWLITTGDYNTFMDLHTTNHYSKHWGFCVFTRCAK
jgi:hypothetical protein